MPYLPMSRNDEKNRTPRKKSSLCNHEQKKSFGKSCGYWVQIFYSKHLTNLLGAFLGALLLANYLLKDQILIEPT